MEASRVGNKEMIQLLVKFRADPNTTNGVCLTLFPATAQTVVLKLT